MNILVTGSNGFIAKNLIIRLKEKGFDKISTFGRENSLSDLSEAVSKADFVFHLAGINRPIDQKEFLKGNANLTNLIIDTLVSSGRSIPIVLSSSVQCHLDNPYGRSKAAAESAVLNYSAITGASSYIYRLPNVFGKWCKPNYNSVVATFCHNTVNGFPLVVNDTSSPLSLVYIDDVCDSFIHLLKGTKENGQQEISPIYNTTVGEVARLLAKFDDSRNSLISEDVGIGLVRALYSTYLSYLKPHQFSYIVPGHSDERGVFVEVIKTSATGQVSFFTAHPGVIRGGHYHHTKNEKFLVLKGKAKYRFRNILTAELYEIITDDTERKIVETVPGWTHDIQNVGREDMVVMLWANEIFDRDNPDTISSPLI